MLLRGRGDGERWQPGLGVDGLQGHRHLARGRRAHPRRDPPQRVPRPGDQTYLPGEMIAWGSSVFLISRTTCQNVVSFWDSQFIV
jgi:hypothetical protein